MITTSNQWLELYRSIFVGSDDKKRMQKMNSTQLFKATKQTKSNTKYSSKITITQYK